MSRFEKAHGGEYDGPPKILLHAVPGWGKTTFAASAPRPIFLQTEEGQRRIQGDHQIAPTASGGRVFREWSDFMDCLRELAKERERYDTIVIDTMDAGWPMLFDHTCSSRKGNHKSIEDFGYGKGWVYVQDDFTGLLRGLDVLNEKFGYTIIVLCHTSQSRVAPPDMEPYTEYRPVGNERLINLLAGWATDIFFGRYHMEEVTDSNNRVRQKGKGERRIYTEDRPAFCAKNRDNLPFELTLPKKGGWAAYQAAVEAANPKPKAKAKK